ncbi:galactokinase [Isoptericola sp. b441]|uniref:Galactokinase n=1 Tax=Actinotalea lenta TaxID=3064654 RepID=A0ABT9D6E8_9CELL|nr:MULTISPECIES: galactokinase [unclassified Isoptericola]MDO8105593.1 galactokinase [Isoptericola sp. b441]MDO8122713.1 galactokinase [Isoptericola sp. b490]
MTAARVRAWDPADGARRATELFRARFAAEPDGVWSAPGRVNLIGEHTDYNGGLCLPIALPHRTYVALGTADDGRVRLTSAQEDRSTWEMPLASVVPGAVDGWPGYAAGVAWSLTVEQPDARLGGFAAAVDSCVPYGAGLSSSAALECAVAVALDDVFAVGLAATDAGRARLAHACIRAENEVAGAATGGMDQTAALRASAGHALLYDTRDGSVQHLPFDLAAHGLALLVVDTRAPHRLVDGQYAARRDTCAAAALHLGVDTLREVTDLDAALAALDTELTSPAGATVAPEVLRARTRHVVTEIARVERFVELLAQGRVAEVGPLLDASHASLRDDYQVSCAELDVAVEAARGAGALGARMTGGGFGGSAIALVPVDAVDAVAAAVSTAFDAAGFTAPAFLVADAAGPAGRTA